MSKYAVIINDTHFTKDGDSVNYIGLTGDKKQFVYSDKYWFAVNSLLQAQRIVHRFNNKYGRNFDVKIVKVTGICAYKITDVVK
jgi:hypothetical protein